MIDDKLVRPNGLMLATGAGCSIVDNSVSMMFYGLGRAARRHGEEQTTLQAARIPEGKESGADGIAIDVPAG